MAKQDRDAVSTTPAPSVPMNATIQNGEPDTRPRIGKAEQYLPATYKTKNGNIREDR